MERLFSETYTYRCGKKVLLEKNAHQFVVRVLPHELERMGWSEMEQVSSASTRITTSKASLEAKMSTSRGLAPTHHAYHLKNTKEEFLITDRIFIHFKKTPSNATLDEFIAKYHLILLEKYRPKEFLFQLTNATDINPVKLVVLLTEEEEAIVKLAEHDLNCRVRKYQVPTPTDSAYGRQWHLHGHLNHPDFDFRATTNCEQAWNALDNFGDEAVVVAVTDDGCRLDHDDFDSPNKFAAWGYFEEEQLITNADFRADPSLMYQSGSDHGTSCAGVIAGEVDALKTVGAAPACRLLPIKWESSGRGLFISDSRLLTALNFIADKVDVMSNSWGNSPTMNLGLPVLNRINELSSTGGRRGKGIVFLWAAGNENCPIHLEADIDIPHEYEENRQRRVTLETSRVFEHNLADLSGVMHVAAIGSTAQRSHYSNYGPGISITAPSNNLHTYGRMEIDGLGITTATGRGFGVTNSFGGTSSATPLVAGIAALVISANPNLTASEVITILKETASKDLNFTGYPRTPPIDFNRDTSWDVSPIAPYDTGQFTNNGLPEGTWSPWFGHGKVDALAAVTLALAGVDPIPTNSFQATDTPNLNIPDNDPGGVMTTINCPNSGKLSAITITVDITHTYIGDLLITLIAPSGKEVVLHNRSGASSNDLKVTFSKANLSALNTFSGESVQGDWQLSIKDLANQDVGILNSWSIDLQFNETNEITVEESSGITIPDNAVAGIERTLNIAQSGKIKAIEIAVDITHTYIGDLEVTLISPRTGSFILHNQTGDNADNLIRKYTMIDTVALATLEGKSVSGNWKLRIVDHAARDVGKLNTWRLRFLLE